MRAPTRPGGPTVEVPEDQVQGRRLEPTAAAGPTNRHVAVEAGVHGVPRGGTGRDQPAVTRTGEPLAR